MSRRYHPAADLACGLLVSTVGTLLAYGIGALGLYLWVRKGWRKWAGR